MVITAISFSPTFLQWLSPEERFGLLLPPGCSFWGSLLRCGAPTLPTSLQLPVLCAPTSAHTGSTPLMRIGSCCRRFPAAVRDDEMRPDGPAMLYNGLRRAVGCGERDPPVWMGHAWAHAAAEWDGGKAVLGCICGVFHEGAAG